MYRIMFTIAFLFVTTLAVHAQEKKSSTSDEPQVAKSFTPVEIEVILAEWTGQGAEKDALTGDGKLFAARFEALEKEGKIANIKRLRITAIDGLRSLLQVSERKAKVIGANVAPGRGTQMQVQYENLGAMLSVLPSVNNGQVILEMNFEQSAPKKSEDAPIISELAGGEKLRAESTGTLQITTTLAIPDGQTVVVGGISEGSGRQLMLVTASIKK